MHLPLLHINKGYKNNNLKNKNMKTMRKEVIGLNTYLYTFPMNCRESFRLAMEDMKKFGIVTEIFLNNELGFELKLFKKI